MTRWISLDARGRYGQRVHALHGCQATADKLVETQYPTPSNVESIASGEFKSALEDASEVELTVTGRKSGNESSRPIWFVEDGERLLLLPIHGTDTGWYRNIVKTPEIGLAAGGAEVLVTAKTIEDASAVSDTVEKFGAKYGAERVKEYYPKQDAFVEAPLSP